MKLVERVNRLEDAHRALAAQHLALQLTCRMMLPLISADPDVVRTKLLVAADTSKVLMDESGQDGDYQANVCRWLEIMSGEIQSSAGRLQRPRSYPGAFEE